MTKHLRKYINQILSEAMVQPDSVSEEYAIWTDLGHFDIAVPGKRYNFVLIEYKEMLSEMRGVSNKLKKLGGLENVSDQKKWDILDDFFHVVFNSVKAVIRVGIPEEENSCNGAWEVLRSAAVEGLGPTMYDLVMSKSPNGLFSDRGSVSDEAFRYWEISANNRDDISKHFLDNADNLYTVTAFDNCDVYGSFDQMELIKFATRQMAIDFFNSNFPVEHQTMIEKMDMHALKFPKKQFDIVYAGWVIIYSENKGRAIQQMLSVTKPGGIIALTATLSHLTAEELEEKRGYVVGSHDRFHKISDLRKLFDQFRPDCRVIYETPSTFEHNSLGMVVVQKTF